jgi:hypothetical protein
MLYAIVLIAKEKSIFLIEKSFDLGSTINNYPVFLMLLLIYF